MYATEDGVLLDDGPTIEVLDRTTGESRWEEPISDDVAVATDGTDVSIVGRDEVVGREAVKLFDRVGVARWSEDLGGIEDSWLTDRAVVTVNDERGARTLALARSRGRHHDLVAATGARAAGQRRL